MKLLDGKKIKKEILDDLKIKLNKLDRKLGLAVIQIGEDKASNIYIKQKEKMAKELGYKFNYIKLDKNVDENYVLNIIDKLNCDNNIDGILLQLPIPENLNYEVIINRISPFKDVDCLTNINIGKLVRGNEFLIPCTALGIIDMLNYYNIDIDKSNIVVVGRGNLVGRPIFDFLINNNATVTLCHSKTNNLADITRRADILIVGVGKAKFITKDMVRDGVIIIDAGVNMVNGKMCGDVDFDSVKDKANYITPVPGGVGQTTVSALGKNIYNAYKFKNNI